MKKTTCLFIIFYSISLIKALGFGGGNCQGETCSGPKPGRLSAFAFSPKQKFDPSLLNLKATANKERTAAAMNAAITISQSEFQTLASAGNTWVSFVADNHQITINVGVANNASSQTWTLPSDVNNSFEYYVRNDFIAVSSVPNYLDVPAGTTHVMKIPYESEDDYEANNYKYYSVTASNVNFLGEDYDYDAQSDDDFDNEPDFIFANVPLALNDSYSSTSELYNPSVNGSLFKEQYTATVDGYGTISTPDGAFDCLRIKYVVNEFTRPTINDTFVASGTVTHYQWVSDNGFTFEGEVVSENTTTHVATLSNIKMNKIVATNLLTETTDVKLNNDSKGVTINTNNDTADPSSILDISSSNKGILIPRIAKANRPASPAEGLLIYQVDETPGFYYYNGTAWRILSSSPSARIAAEEPVNESISGKNQLQEGSTFIKFDQPRDDFEKLIISLQLEGDCNGVYISKKTREGFEVKELQKGKSNVKFSWRID